MPDPPDAVLDPNPGFVTKDVCYAISSGVKEQLTIMNGKLDSILELKDRVTVLEEHDKARDKEEQKEDQDKGEKKQIISGYWQIIIGLLLGFALQIIAKFIP